MVVSAGGWQARCLGTKTPLRVISVGARLQVLFDPANSARACFSEIRPSSPCIGCSGQKHLESLTVAIVGLGGTGSIAAEQLAYLGVRKFILIDPIASS